MNIALLKEFFMCCTIINAGIFMLTAMISIFGREFIYRVHGKMFDLSKVTVNAMLYGFLAFYKIVFIVFVLVPWIVLTIIS